MRVWLTSFGDGADAAARELADVMSADSLALDADCQRCVDGVAVLVFRPDEEGLAEWLRDHVLARRPPLIGVALDPCAAPWRLLELGLIDLVPWGTLTTVEASLTPRLLRRLTVAEALSSPMVRRNLIGASAAWIQALHALVEATLFGAGPVLITGESGTGKELFARVVHGLSERRKAELVTVDATTLVPDLAGSELFGHSRGAYTGATGAREGAVAMADKGTLFLDEVGELPPRLQAQMLRVIQEGRYKRVGDNKWQSSDFRLVAATNRDLPTEIERGAFRADLYFRIAGVTIELPPLRNRTDDILPLARHFLCESLGREEPPEIDWAVQSLLVERDYPGNVRELRQLVGRIALRHAGAGPVTIGDIPPGERPGGDMPADSGLAMSFEPAVRCALSLNMSLKEIGRSATDTAIRLAMTEAKGNTTRAAQRLSVTPRALQLREASRRSEAG